jgi:hypothetical protein
VQRNETEKAGCVGYEPQLERLNAKEETVAKVIENATIRNDAVDVASKRNAMKVNRV